MEWCSGGGMGCFNGLMENGLCCALSVVGIAGEFEVRLLEDKQPYQQQQQPYLSNPTISLLRCVKRQLCV
jgi:hypothetical protein